MYCLPSPGVARCLHTHPTPGVAFPRSLIFTRPARVVCCLLTLTLHYWDRALPPSPFLLRSESLFTLRLDPPTLSCPGGPSSSLAWVFFCLYRPAQMEGGGVVRELGW